MFRVPCSSKLINVLQTHIKNAINNKPPDAEVDCCTNSNDDLLYKTTKNLQYIMKFIIRSRILFAGMNDDKDRVLFESSLEDLLSSFVSLISCSNDLLRSQGAMLKYIHVIASDLIQVYDKIKLRYCSDRPSWWSWSFLNWISIHSQYIVEIIRNIPAGRLTQSKMICIKDLVKSKLFKYPECRGILLPVFCQQIKDKLESKEEVSFFHTVGSLFSIFLILFSW